MGFSRQEYWSGGSSDLAIELKSPELKADSLLSEPPGKPNELIMRMFAMRMEPRVKNGLQQPENPQILLNSQPLGWTHFGVIKVPPGSAQ